MPTGTKVCVCGANCGTKLKVCRACGYEFKPQVKVINHCILVTSAQRHRAVANLAKRGVAMRRTADNAKIARAICAQLGVKVPSLPEELGRMVIAYANGDAAGTDADRTVLPPMKPYVPPRLPENQQQRMDSFRAIPSLCS